jgi:hypothetical protein
VRKWKKSSIRKFFIISVGHLRVVELAYMYTGGKFAAGVVDTSGNFPPVSLTPLANLPPVSLTPATNNTNDTGGKFATGVVDTGGAS